MVYDETEYTIADCTNGFEFASGFSFRKLIIQVESQPNDACVHGFHFRSARFYSLLRLFWLPSICCCSALRQ